MDYKNVQRRTYDVLNVLCALKEINKTHNHITYIGGHNEKRQPQPPSTQPATQEMKAEKIARLRETLAQKKAAHHERAQALKSSIIWQMGTKKLVDQNMALKEDDKEN